MECCLLQSESLIQPMVEFNPHVESCVHFSTALLYIMLAVAHVGFPKESSPGDAGRCRPPCQAWRLGAACLVEKIQAGVPRAPISGLLFRNFLQVTIIWIYIYILNQSHSFLFLSYGNLF